MNKLWLSSSAIALENDFEEFRRLEHEPISNKAIHARSTHSKSDQYTFEASAHAIAHIARIQNARLLSSTVGRPEHRKTETQFRRSKRLLILNGLRSTSIFLSSFAPIAVFVLGFTLYSRLLGVEIQASLYAAYKYILTIVAIGGGVAFAGYLFILGWLRRSGPAFRICMTLASVAILIEVAIVVYLALEKVLSHYG